MNTKVETRDVMCANDLLNAIADLPDDAAVGMVIDGEVHWLTRIAISDSETENTYNLYHLVGQFTNEHQEVLDGIADTGMALILGPNEVA